MDNTDNRLTTKEVAEMLGVTTSWILKLIHDGRLAAEKFGRDYTVSVSDIDAVRNLKRGRPRKAADGEGASGDGN